MAAKGKQRKQEWNRAGLGAAAVAGAGAVAGLGWLAAKFWKKKEARSGAAATSEDPVEGHAGNSGAARSAAGPETMRDPPAQWSDVDETSDESFPASDPPPAGGSKVD